MNRRELLKKLGIGAAMIPAAPAILAGIKPAAVAQATTTSNSLTAMQPKLFAIKGAEYTSGTIRFYQGRMTDESKCLATLGFSEPFKPQGDKQL